MYVWHGSLRLDRARRISRNRISWRSFSRRFYWFHELNWSVQCVNFWRSFPGSRRFPREQKREEILRPNFKYYLNFQSPRGQRKIVAEFHGSSFHQFLRKMKRSFPSKIAVLQVTSFLCWFVLPGKHSLICYIFELVFFLIYGPVQIDINLQPAMVFTV